MLIYLLRHGTAEDARPGIRDHERALTEDGWKKLRRALPAWQSLCSSPDVVLVSPLRRAQETASVFAEALDCGKAIRTEVCLTPESGVQTAMSMIEAEQHSGTKCLALIGHEPHLGYLLGLLLTGHPRLPIPLKKGMLVAVETESTASLVAGLRLALTQRAAGELGEQLA